MVTFGDIQNIIKLSSYFAVYAKPVDEEQKKSLKKLIKMHFLLYGK